MRIITGKLKNKLLNSPRQARPTTSLVREAIFNMLFSLQIDLQQSSVLDLFACTGSLAFEALSRGAQSALLVEQDQKYTDAIEKFIKANSLEAKCLKMNVLNLPEAIGKFNLVFIDPPYRSTLVEKTLKILETRNWLAQNACLVCETSTDEEFLSNLQGTYIKVREKCYGKTKLTILLYVARGSPEAKVNNWT